MRGPLVAVVAALLATLSITLASRQALAAAAEGSKAPPVMVHVVSRSGPPAVGELVSETATAVTVRDLKTNRERAIEKKDVLRIARDLSDDDLIRETDLPSVVAWKVTKFSASTPAKGRVAKVSDAVIYLTLGTNAGLTTGQTLNVFHVVGDITDPATGKVIGRERSRIGQLQVTEVQDTYAKARRLGDLEVKLSSGDEVETIPLKVSVAVIPLLDVNGEQTDAGTAVAEDLTTALVGKKVPVVERTLLINVLKELALQYTDLVDPAKAQQFGKQIGASTVLTGKIVPDGASGGRTKTHVRLVNVETGEVLLAAAKASAVAAATPRGPGAGPSSAEAAATSPRGSGGTGNRPAASPGARASTGGVAHAPPPENKVIGEDEHKGLATNHPSFTKANVYTVKVDPKDPLVRLGSSAVYFQAACPADRGVTQGTVKASTDYGKTWVLLRKWETADFKAAKRRDGWFGVDLAPAFRKTPDAEVDEIQVRFDVDGIVEGIEIEKVIWARK